jgi:hypothetical protein
MVLVLTSSRGRYLSDSIVNPHEVGVFRELGDDFTCAFGGGVHLIGDLVKGLCEIPDGEGFAETSTPFVSLPVAFTSGILVVIGFIGRCIGRQLAC